MSRLVALMTVMVTMSIALPQADATTYFVEAVTLSNGYEITGGFIETNDALGPLMESDITDYEINVTGAFPFVFAPTNSGATVFISGNLDASPLDLSLLTDPDPAQAVGSQILLFSASELVALDFVEHSLSFRNVDDLVNPPTSSVYQYDRIDVLGDSAIAFLSVSPQAIITVASIPEPSSMVLFLTAVLFGAGMGRRRKRQA